MKRLLPWIAALALLAACATTDDREPGWLARVDAIHERHAGQDVNSIVFGGARTWFRGGYNSLVLETRKNTHYLVSLSGPCDPELRFARDIRLHNSHRNRLSTFDSISVGGQTCRVFRIRPLDMAAVRKEMAALDEDDADKKSRELQVSGGTNPSA